MTLTDQADFVIADTGIHRGLVAWKLGASAGRTGTAPRIFSVQVFSRFSGAADCVANSNATPASRQDRRKPIQRDRSAFGGLKPVDNGPNATG